MKVKKKHVNIWLCEEGNCKNHNGDDGEACECQCVSDAGVSCCYNDNGDVNDNDVSESAECCPINEDNDDDQLNRQHAFCWFVLCWQWCLFACV